MLLSMSEAMQVFEDAFQREFEELNQDGFWEHVQQVTLMPNELSFFSKAHRKGDPEMEGWFWVSQMVDIMETPILRSHAMNMAYSLNAYRDTDWHKMVEEQEKDNSTFVGKIT